MDSSYYSHRYGQWHGPFPPRPPPPSSSSPSSLPSPRPQSYPGNPKSSNNGDLHQNYQRLSHRHVLPPPPPPPPVVNQPRSYYSAQEYHALPPPPPPPPQHHRYDSQQLTYESPRMSSLPSQSSSCTESRGVPQSAWIERKDNRPDSWKAVADSGRGRNYQFDYGRLSRGSSGDSISHGSDRNSRFRDELRSLAYARQDFGAARIERNYQERGQLKSESSSSRVLGAGNRGISSSCGYSNDQYRALEDRGMIRGSAGNGRSGSQRWAADGGVSNGGRTAFSQKKDDYYRSEIERYFPNGSREGSNELNRTPKKQMQKKSVLLRIEHPRSSQKGRDNERSWNPSYYDENRSNSFSKGHLVQSDRGLVEKQRGRAPVDLDVTFKSNVLVAKAVESPPTAIVTSGVSVIPRSSKVRRTLSTDTDEKDSLNGGTVEKDFKTHVTDKASSSVGFKQPERLVSASEKEPDTHSSPSSVVSKDNITVGKLLEGVLSDCKVKNTDTIIEASVDDGATKVCSSALSGEKVSSSDEALKQSRDEIDAEHDSNLKLSSTGENVSDEDRSRLKSHEDVLGRKGTSRGAGEILSPEAMKKKTIMKKMMKRGSMPSMSPEAQPASLSTEKTSKYFQGGVWFAGMSMHITEPQPFEGNVWKNCLKGVSSTHLLLNETDVGFGGSKSLSSSLGALDYGGKESNESSPEAVMPSSCGDVVDQYLAKAVISKSCGIGEGSERICQKGDSPSSDDEFSRIFPEDLGSSENDKCGTFILEANHVSGAIVNANNFILESNTTPSLDSTKKTIVQSDSQVSPSFGSVYIEGSLETIPFKKVEERGSNFVLDADKQTSVNFSSSSSKNVAGKGSCYASPVGRISDCAPGVCRNKEGLSDESDSVRPLSSELCVKYVSSNNVVPDQDMNLGSHHPAENSFTDVLDISRRKTCFTESNVWPCKETNVSQGEFSLDQEVRESMPSSCGKVPGSPALIIDNNLAIGNINESDKDTVLGPEFCSPEDQPSSEGDILLEDRLECRSSDATGSFWDSSVDDDLIKDSSMVSSRLIHDNSANLRHLSPLPPVNEQMYNQASVRVNSSKCQGGITEKESGSIENLEESSECRTRGTDIDANREDSVFPCGSFSIIPGLTIGQAQTETSVAGIVDKTSTIKESEKENALLDALQEQTMTFHETDQSGNFLELCPCSGRTSPGTDAGYYEPLVPSNPDAESTEKQNDDPMENLPDVLSDVDSQEKSLTVANADILQAEAPPFDGKVFGSVALGNSDAPPSKSLSHADVKSVLIDAKDHAMSVPAPDSKTKALALSSASERIPKKESTFNYAVQKNGSHSSFVVTGKRNVNPPTRITKPNTWHRKSDPSPLAAAKPLSSTFSTQLKLHKATAQVNSSYMRKGNSLVRKPSHGTPAGVSLGLPPLSLQVNHMVVDEDNSVGSVGRANADETSILGKAGETYSPERQSILPSDISKISNSVTTSGKCTLSSGLDLNGFLESIKDSAISEEADVPNSGEVKSSEILNQTGIPSNCQKKENPANLPTSNPRKVLYVKRKSNQLVAASDALSFCKSQIPPADGYFKRSKNQLVRTSDSHVKLAVMSPDDALDSQAQATAKIVPKRNFNSAFSDVAAAKPFKRSKFSLVWTLNDKQPGEANRLHMQCQKILPQLVPWKRATYWRKLMNSVPVLRNGSLPTVSRKLLLLRKRHTVYTRSSNGFSLRKSKVLSIGGTHLKWSKSIEKNSKKANEEATLAVAAFAKKKSENCSGQDITGAKSMNHLARERIFRIGSIRYKMDPSRRTLQRISDVKSPGAGPLEFGKDVKKSFIPRRLVIGNDEYVRVGNGNQLVRDPKKRTRALANEKVRWSLYNVRSRLARKKKYCQFFTRFGKCNKCNGKCPYIHDPSKIAVCTKFLNGLCTDPNCRLTHKVIPERMPDCSYYLQGLCNNGACPYRHVHVNPNAPICEGFLKGYCSDGNECRKKHTNTCPVFDTTGSCPQGSKCKLHHPKNRSRIRKRKRVSEPLQKNARGRYFGSLLNVLPGAEPVLADRSSAKNSADSRGEASGFIRLDVSEDEVEESNSDTVNERSVSGNSGDRDSRYELIRPVGLMQR